MKLILVHGIWQNTDKNTLKTLWISFIKTGFEKLNLDTKILDKMDIDFVYYHDLHQKYKTPKKILNFKSSEQLLDPITLTATELVYEFGEPEHIAVLEQSDLIPNKYTALKLLAKILDGSKMSVTLARIFAKEVYLYRSNEQYKNEVNQRFLDCLGYPSVVIGHSLGSIVTFNSLSNQDSLISSYITLGSPLAGKTFSERVTPLVKPKCCKHDWANIHHENDPVYIKNLKSMDKDYKISSKASNPHYIATYLTHPTTAQVIYDALTKQQ